jgi:hypothetical protein
LLPSVAIHEAFCLVLVGSDTITERPSEAKAKLFIISFRISAVLSGRGPWGLSPIPRRTSRVRPLLKAQSEARESP